MPDPKSPPERDKTPRQAILEVMTDTPMSAHEISGLAGVSEKDVYEHLLHLRVSKKGRGGISVVPAKCRKCGYDFVKRERLTKPGRCPKCKEKRIAAPKFYLTE